jgi:hypothetical protein
LDHIDGITKGDPAPSSPACEAEPWQRPIDSVILLGSIKSAADSSPTNVNANEPYNSITAQYWRRSSAISPRTGLSNADATNGRCRYTLGQKRRSPSPTKRFLRSKPVRVLFDLEEVVAEGQLPPALAARTARARSPRSREVTSSPCFCSSLAFPSRGHWQVPPACLRTAKDRGARTTYEPYESYA